MVDSILLSSKDYRNFIIETIKQDKVAIYGTGKFAMSVASYLLDKNIDLQFFIDDPQYFFVGKTLKIKKRNIRCIEYGEARELCKDVVIINGNIDYNFCTKIEEDFYNVKNVYYLDLWPEHIVSKGFLEENRNVLDEIYHVLSDEESRDVLRSYLYSRLTGDVSSIAKMNHSCGKMYDWELLELKESDIVVDAGAYTGDTICEIFEYLKGGPKRIIAFEPDEENCSVIKKNFFGSEKWLKIVESGLYSREDKFSFIQPGTLGAKISEEDSGVSIRVCSLDEECKNDKITIIKMDIEGSELEALKGSKNIIEEYRPRLAVCIYHNNIDIIEIYEYLKKYNYKFYLRQHSNSVEETVLYAL